MNYKKNREDQLFGRYIINEHITPLQTKHQELFDIKEIGSSVENRSIVSYTYGVGKKRILIWSQMHGNESTTTKALFDFFNWLHLNSDLAKQINKGCTLCVIPIVNPDGAERYTRLNANRVDLNRDAQDLTQPESKVLRQVFDRFKPDYCFNMHGQRTIFSAGYSSNPSVLSFLSPAEDEQRSVTKVRKKAMEVIVAIAEGLKEKLPNQISRYDDGFNLNCVGDTFQALKVPTILFEAGHYANDYNREITRELVFESLIIAIQKIALNEVNGDNYKAYFNLPENQKLFFDLIIRNVSNEKGEIIDVAIQYEEILNDDKVVFEPKVAKVGDLSVYYGHQEVQGGGAEILINESAKIEESLIKIKKISIDGEDVIKKVSFF